MADQVARRMHRTAVIDTDNLRRMLVATDDVDLEEAWLTALNASSLADNCVEAGCDVVIVEVLSDEMAEFYRARLSEHDVRIVLLMPTEDEMNRRLMSHTDYLSRGDMTELYRLQEQFTGYDDKVDNSEIGPGAVADFILSQAGVAATAAR